MRPRAYPHDHGDRFLLTVPLVLSVLSGAAAPLSESAALPGQCTSVVSWSVVPSGGKARRLPRCSRAAGALNGAAVLAKPAGCLAVQPTKPVRRHQDGKPEARPRAAWHTVNNWVIAARYLSRHWPPGGARWMERRRSISQNVLSSIDGRLIRVQDHRKHAQPVSVGHSADRTGSNQAGFWLDIEDEATLVEFFASVQGARLVMFDPKHMYEQPGPRWYRPWSPQVVLTKSADRLADPLLGVRSYRFGGWVLGGRTLVRRP